MFSSQTASLPDDYADHLAWENLRRHSLVDSSSTISTNATASNLEGAGRTMGRLIERLGAHVDAFMNEWATRHGYGPKRRPSTMAARQEHPWLVRVIVTKVHK